MLGVVILAVAMANLDRFPDVVSESFCGGVQMSEGQEEILDDPTMSTSVCFRDLKYLEGESRRCYSGV